MLLDAPCSTEDRFRVDAPDTYAYWSPRKIKKIFAILEPLLMLFIIGLVGVVALSIFMPIMEMMTAANGK